MAVYICNSEFGKVITHGNWQLAKEETQYFPGLTMAPLN